MRAAVRAAGIGSLKEVQAVVLETDGSFSVVRNGEEGNSSLTGIRAPQDVSERAAPGAAADGGA